MKSRFVLTDIQGERKVSQVTKTASNCLPVESSFAYDEQGNLVEKRITLKQHFGEDQLRTVRYVYGHQGLLVGTVINPEAEQPSVYLIQRDPTGLNPLFTNTNGTAYVFEYDNAGQLLRQVQLPNDAPEAQLNFDSDGDGLGNLQELLAGSDPWTTKSGQPAALPRIPEEAISVTYRYENGLLMAIDGPRKDIADTTTFTYNSAGYLASMTNALGQTTQYQHYNQHGLPETLVHANGHQVQLEYDDWLLLPTKITESQRNAPATITQLQYNEQGQLLRVENPQSGRWHQNDHGYHQDSYHFSRKYGETNSAGEYWRKRGNNITYTNATQESYTETIETDGRGNVLSHLSNQKIPSTKQTYFAYTSDNQLNSFSYNYASQIATKYQYDALGRLSWVVEALNDRHQYQYSDTHQLVTIRAANGAETQYQYDQFGRRNQQMSPDTGKTTFVYDESGNVIAKTDARGVEQFWAYDALNRVTERRFAQDADLNTQWQYDQAVNIRGKTFANLGQLSGITQGHLHHSFGYDAQGNLLAWQRTDTETLPKLSDSILYTRNAHAEITSMAFDEGSLHFTRDDAGRVIKSWWTAEGVTLDLLKEVKYFAFSDKPITFTLGDTGTQVMRSIKKPFELGIIHKGKNSIYPYFQVSGNTTKYNYYNLLGQPVWRMNLDKHSPSKRIKGIYPNRSPERKIQFDANNNRTQYEDIEYRYQANSNRLIQFGEHNITYDKAGNPLTYGDFSLTYNAAGKLTELSNKGTPVASYRYNAFGQRIEKRLATGEVTQFLYSGSQLLKETAFNRQGERLWTKIYAYLGQRPIAVIQLVADAPAEAFYIWQDTVKRPLVVTNSEGDYIWLLNEDPFGVGTFNEDYDQDGTNFTLNLRFPGHSF